ncbi:MAG: ribonuclease HII [Exiguobacterium profundum]|nr:MAG: ribonuclease HII [Exiguobacterium profundum]
MVSRSPDFNHETRALARGQRPVAGVDEVGRGPLAGPVIAAAVILDPARIPAGLADSKALTARARERLDEEIRSSAVAVTVAEASVEEIDRLNILHASLLAMRRAVEALPEVGFVLVDGNRLPPGLPCPAEAVVKGDALVLSIAAASIVAKVARDRLMVDLAQQHPGYGWEANAHYPTKAHLEALLHLGCHPWHRRSFGPVHKILYQED